jgi:2-oxoglutarate dehydrogenase E1 component
VSPKNEFIEGGFQEIIGDAEVSPRKATRVILCSGKIFYELVAYRKAQKIDDVAIVRVEQLYPFHKELWSDVLMQYGEKKKWIWCQEEPRNMGAWNFIRDQIGQESKADVKLIYAGREPSASPAAGSLALHKKEQAKLIAEAFNL